MGEKRSFLTVKELCILAFLTVVLFLQEQLLTFLPNIQLTVLLILVYAKVLGFMRTAAVITVYVLMDSFFMGSVNPVAVLCLWIGWMIIPLAAVTLLKNNENTVLLALAAIVFALLFSWCQIPAGCMILGVGWKAYLASDVLFEILLAASSFLSVLLLYEPLKKLLTKLWNNR